MKIWFIAITSMMLLSCAPRVDVKEPLDLVWDKSTYKTDELIIFLPGLYDVAEKFKKEKFFSLARKAGIHADLVAASVHLEHLLENHVIQRIERDVFTPALNDGYKRIWFVGVSLGGLNSLLFYKKHAQFICGVVLLAPYLGDKSITTAIQNAGGINNWKPDHFDNPEEVKNKALVDLRVHKLWHWIKEDKKNGNHLKQVYLGFGSHDRYAKAHQIFSTFLEEKNVHEVNGEHNWKTGRKIWQQQLASRKQTGLLGSCN